MVWVVVLVVIDGVVLVWLVWCDGGVVFWDGCVVVM